MEATTRTFEPLEYTADGVRQTEPWANDIEKEKLFELLDSARRATRRRAVVEVGSWAGANAILMSNAGYVVYCVDTWRGGRGDATEVIARALGPKNVFQTFCRNVGTRLLDTIIPCVGHSRTWAEIWPFQVSAVFIDASHDYESVKEDIALWWPHVLPGGVLCGHDYELFPGVKQAADEFGIDGSHKEIWWKWKPTA